MFLKSLYERLFLYRMAKLEEEQKAKDDELKQLTDYINTMNQNFSQMLKTTLTKMKERIN